MMHELYCGGHLIEAGVAYHRVTGKRKLLDVGIKFADHCVDRFAVDQVRTIPGHQEIELALMRLFRATGERKYLGLAQFFLDERGQYHDRPVYGVPGRPHYLQDHTPVREQFEAVGHTVRAVYMYAAMADMVAAGDKSYMPALNALWKDAATRKTYITGGAGGVGYHESFYPPYFFPTEPPDVDTCTPIGLVFWTHRMNRLQPDGKYGDYIERVIYNRVPAGVSLDGKHFFYGCPLKSPGNYHRGHWFPCACCPPSVVRFFASVGDYIYTYDDTNVYANQYIAGRAKLSVGGVKLRLKQESNYPWGGQIRLTLDPEKPVKFALKLRIPAWCEGARLKLNGQPVKPQIVKGFATLDREWTSGDAVDLDLPLPISVVRRHPHFVHDSKCVALMRGPVVYCLEAVDNDGHVFNRLAPEEANLTPEHRDDLLGGVTVIKGTTNAVFREGDKTEVVSKPFTAVPFCVWDNRAHGQMVVWLPEDAKHAQPAPGRGK